MSENVKSESDGLDVTVASQADGPAEATARAKRTRRNQAAIMRDMVVQAQQRLADAKAKERDQMRRRKQERDESKAIETGRTVVGRVLEQVLQEKIEGATEAWDFVEKHAGTRAERIRIMRAVVLARANRT